jgi:NAD(P)-dependent dehydrogenase (short-subunit alcohol dehydrogenase family)
MSTNTTPVWFITGCSTGFGRELAQAVIARGWHCVATARRVETLDDLARGNDEQLLRVPLDVTDSAQIEAAVAAAQKRFGAIDVLVNNAGYGYQSTVEEGEEREIRAQFDANVFGLFAMTRAVLPVMRAQHRGHVINITSVAGLVGFPGSGYYAASKHAVEGWSDSLFAEVKPLGINVTCVEPGLFRTDWAGRSLRQTPSHIADYAETGAARMKRTAEISGKQAGDPARAALAMIRITEVENPPRHLVLGAFGVDAVANRLRAALAEIDEWRATSVATDFPVDA